LNRGVCYTRFPNEGKDINLLPLFDQCLFRTPFENYHSITDREERQKFTLERVIDYMQDFAPGLLVILDYDDCKRYS
jgi:hypothetical protein